MVKFIKRTIWVREGSSAQIRKKRKKVTRNANPFGLPKINFKGFGGF